MGWSSRTIARRWPVFSRSPSGGSATSWTMSGWRERPRCGTNATTLGFYLELTGRLGGDRRLVRRASGLRDRRRTALRPFFSDGRGAFARAAAEERSPALARRWGLLMNMELESFATAFRKHVSVAA